jgi:branched-chain amino acid transport system permease protein
VAFFAFLAVPFLASEYLLRAILVPFLTLAIAAIGLNLLVGYCGQISLGSAAFHGRLCIWDPGSRSLSRSTVPLRSSSWL